MPLDPDSLASDIKDGVGAPEVTDEIQGMSDAIVDYMKTGAVNFIASINGASPDGSDATGVGGVIVLAPGGLVTLFASVFPSTPQTIGLATAIENHLLTGVYALNPGDISGGGSGTWIGVASGGSVSGYSGSVLAPLIATAVQAPGVTPEIQGMADAIADHITDNVQLDFALVQGGATTPPAPPSGPIAASALAGVIS